MPPAAEHCFDLDDGKATPIAAAPVKQLPQPQKQQLPPQFEPLDRGRPYSISHREPMVAGGKRSNADTDHD
jgi:hypothetical protein